MVIFSVKDTGIGIAAEDLNRIFEEYGQIENPLQKRAKGIGLGLPLTRKLAELLGGSVSVAERAGRRVRRFSPSYRAVSSAAERAPSRTGRRRPPQRRDRLAAAPTRRP